MNILSKLCDYAAKKKKLMRLRVKIFFLIISKVEDGLKNGP